MPNMAPPQTPPSLSANAPLAVPSLVFATLGCALLAFKPHAVSFWSIVLLTIISACSATAVASSEDLGNYGALISQLVHQGIARVLLRDDGSSGM